MTGNGMNDWMEVCEWMNEWIEVCKFVLLCNCMYTSICIGTEQKSEQILTGFSMC